MSLRRVLFLVVTLVIPAAEAAETVSTPVVHRVILRLDGILYGRGGAKGSGGTKIEDPAAVGSSASFGSTFGAGIAAQVRLFKALWGEAGGSWFDPELEVVRSHGLGEPVEVHTGRVSVTSYSLGIEVRPARWNIEGSLQIGLFLRQVWSRFGAPPAGAGVELECSADGLNFGARADYRIRKSPWLVGLEVSFGGGEPKLSDPSAGTVHKVQIADLFAALGVRREF